MPSIQWGSSRNFCWSREATKRLWTVRCPTRFMLSAASEICLCGYHGSFRLALTVLWGSCNTSQFFWIICLLCCDEPHLQFSEHKCFCFSHSVVTLFELVKHKFLYYAPVKTHMNDFQFTHWGYQCTKC